MCKLQIISPLDPYFFKRTNTKVQNRSVLAAMTNKQSYPNGVISKKEIDWLVERAKGGFGIITTAATNISIESKGWEGEFGVYDDIHIPNLNKLTSAVHHYDSLIFAQLFHGGIKSPQKLTGVVPLSASELKCIESETGKCRSASENDINVIIKDFTSAAIRCAQSGFDGIELHGAHGYLISQFLGTKTNLRKDKWGQNLEGRSRLLTQICKSIKQNVPESFIIGVRLSPELSSIGINLNDTITLIGILKKQDIDFIHLSCWDVFASSKTSTQKNNTLTEIITSSYSNLPTIISTGGVWSKLDAQRLLKQGSDLIGVARVAIAHPNWANNLSITNYNPKRPPFTHKQLKDVKLSNIFIDYMKNWKGFIID